MERSQSLPIGYFIAGICVACFCALALITAWFYMKGQNGTGQSPQISLNPRVNFSASPLRSTDQPKNLDDGPFALAGYERSSEGIEQTPVDLIRAARIISGRGNAQMLSAAPGLMNSLSDDPSPEFVPRPPVELQATPSPVVNPDDIEADRQWLLSLEMNDSPDSSPETPFPIAQMNSGLNSLTIDETRPNSMPSHLPNNMATAVDFSAPLERLYSQRTSATSESTVAVPTNKSPSVHAQTSMDQRSEPGAHAPANHTPAPMALEDNSPSIETETANQEPAHTDTPELSLPEPDQVPDNSAPADTNTATTVESSDAFGDEAATAVRHTKIESAPVAASIGDRPAASENYQIGDQTSAPDAEPSHDDDLMFANQQQSQITGWPLPSSLMNELDEWKSITLTSQWAAAVEDTLVQLNNTRLDDPQSYSHIEYCDQLADQLAQHARTLPRGQELLSSQMYRLSLRMKRRFAIWVAVHQLAGTQIASQAELNSSTVARFINQRQLSFDNSDVPAEWVDYLMLDKAAEVFSSSRATELHRQTMARKIMSRVTSTSLNDEQIRYARQLVGEELGSSLRDVSSGKIDLGKFLNDLESFEEGSSAIADALINNHFQSFYWSRDVRVQELAAVFDENYRTPNFQIEISERLINSVLPRNMTVNEPVQDRILGAQVFGNSRVQNQLSVELIPDPSRLSFRMISNGSVLSRTRAHASGFVFNSLGNAMVNTSKGISIGPEGVFTLPADVEADAHSRLLNVRSRMDNVPLVGWMARQVAEQKQQQQSQQANLIVEQKLRNEFGNRVDQEIQARVDQGRVWVQQNIVEPFNAMELEPMIANMRTTESAAIVQYRLAGLDQNAANTVRPKSLPGSLVGVQIHESAVNNIINRIDINGKTFTAPEFMRHISAMLGRSDVELNEGEYEDVKFQLASRDGVRLDFDDDRVAITLRLKKLQIGRSGLWKNLIVTAWYVPHATGLKVDMILDLERGVSLSGQNLSFGDQLTVRTVFNALFKPDFDFPLLPAELATRPAAQGVGVTQIVLVDGWAGLSVSEFRAIGQSQAEQPPLLRNARILQNRWK